MLVGQTIKSVLSKAYQVKKLKYQVLKTVIRESLYAYTKEVQFMFNDEIYIQNNRVAMGSSLGPLLAKIFVMPLE